MSIIINFIVGILIFNFLGGCLAFLVWKVTSRVAMKFYKMRLISRLLMISILDFIVPVGFVVYVVRCFAKYASAASKLYIFEIVRSKTFLGIAIVMIAVWTAGCVWEAVRIKRLHACLWHPRRWGRPLNEMCQKIYEEEKQALGVKSDIIIQTNPLVSSSHVFFYKGVHLIQISTVDLEEEEFRIICRHELYHIKASDYRNQRIIEWISVINWYNFFVRYILKEANMWVDICRDMDVIMHGDIKAESYYRDMACILKKQQEMQDPLPFGMTFVKKNTLIYRMNVVTKYFEKERKNSPAQGIAVILLFCMLFAAAIGSGEFMFRKSFLYLYGLTRTSVVEQYTYTASAEYCEERSSVKAEIMEGEALNNDSLQFTFGWKRGKRLESQEIYLEQGQAISFIGDACGASDEDKHRYIECKYGYTDQTSDYFCVGEGSLLHTFYVQESGYYRFFAENLSDSNEGIELEMTVTIINSK